MTKNICELCKKTAHKSSIIGDIYYRRICDVCYADLMSSEGESSGLAAYNRARDLEDHEADVIQPTSGGKISKEFIQLYTDKARQMFSDDEIDQAMRS